MRLPIALCFFTVLFFSSSLLAQDQQPPAEDQKSVPQPIPAAEITSRSESTVRILQEISRELQVNPSITKIDSLFPDFGHTIATLRADFTEENIDQASLRALRSSQEQWSLVARQLRSWHQTIENRAQEIDRTKEQLRSLRAEWEVTRSASAAAELPPTLRQSIASTIAAIDQREQSLRERRTLILNLLKKVSDESIVADEILRRIELEMTEYADRLLVQDSKPIWDLVLSPDETIRSKDFTSINQKKLDALKGFVNQNAGLLYAYAAFIVLIAVLMTAAKRNAEKALKDSDHTLDEKIPIAVQRPVSATVFIALLFIRLLMPTAPDVFFKITGFFMLVPVIRILPLLLPKGFRPLAFIVAGVFVFHRIVTLTADAPDIYRMLILVLILVATSAVLWFLNVPLFREKAVGARMRTWGRIFSYATIFSFALGFLANILGFTGLSELLVDSTLSSIYSAVALVAGVLILHDLLTLLIRTRAGQSLHLVRDNEALLRRRFTRLLWVVAVFYWLTVVLSNFNIWVPIRDVVVGVFSYQFSVGSVSFSLGSFVAVFVTVWISVLLSRLIRFALDADILPRMNLSKGLAPTISTMVYYVGIIFGLVLAASIIGLRWDTLAIIVGALGVGIGFGLQNLVNNVVSGLILMFERPINVGDTIEFGSRFGHVLHIGLRASTVRSFDGAEVIVPNSNLISSEVVNWTLSDRHRRMEVNVGVEYGTDPQQVLDILLRVARNHPLVMKEPEPFAWFMSFGESSLDFVVKFWIAQFEDAFTVRSEITVAINNALKDAGITIPFPQRDLHVRSIDPDVTKTLGSGKGKKD